MPCAPLSRARLDKIAWRGFLIAVVAFVTLLIAVQFPPALNYPQLGFDATQGRTTSEIQIQTVERGGSADAAGLRPGDRIDLAPLSVRDRIRLLYQRHAGDDIPVTVWRGERQIHATIQAERLAGVRFDYWLGIAGSVFLLAFALIIGWRSDRRATRLLSLVLLATVVATALDVVNFSKGGPGIELAGWVLAALVAPIAPLLLTLYANLFGAPSRARTGFTFLQYALAILSAIANLAPVVAIVSLTIAPTSAYALSFINPTLDLQFVCAFVSAILAVVASRGDARQRILWATIASAPFIFANIFTGLPGVPDWIGNVALLIWPIGLTYAALRGKLLDVAFAINRAAVFAIVSAIVLVLFVAFEWVLAEWFAPVGHETDLILSLGFALVLGISMRFIHHRVDHLIDKVLFRKRNADIAALQTFAQEAPFVTNREVLIARTAAIVTAHTNATVASLVLDGGALSDDPAMVALRARRVPVDPQELGSAFDGVLALPMFAGATFFGALVCGAKMHGEAYAPDEIVALQAVARGDGEALLLLHAGNDQRAMLERIATGQEHIITELRELLARPPEAT